MESFVMYDSNCVEFVLLQVILLMLFEELIWCALIVAEASVKSLSFFNGGVADKQVEKYNGGMKRSLNKQVGKYNGGMKRSLSVAISLIGDSKIALLSAYLLIYSYDYPLFKPSSKLMGRTIF
ncbi:ABC transporter A family member 7 [Tanacetum coccineum]